MQKTNDTTLSPDGDAAALQAFCAHAIKDLALQSELQQADCTEQSKFMDRLLGLARRRGFVFSAEAVAEAMRARMLMLDGVAAAPIHETPLPPRGWLPIRTSWQGCELYAHWAHFGTRRLREPFFENTVRICLAQPFNRVLGYLTAIDKLAAWLDQTPHLQPSGLIFHMSRCGSTLVSQMLAALDSNIVVSEASPIDGVVQAHLTRPDAGQDRACRGLRAIVAALGQQRSGGERHFIIKLDCWHTAALPLFRRAFPEVPWIFLYRDPIEVLVSQLQMPGSQMMPQSASHGASHAMAHGATPAFHAIKRSYGPGMAEDYYAQVLAKICRPVLQHLGDGGGLLVNYRDLPDAVLSTILPHFRIACSTNDRARMLQAARFDAKAPGFTFAPDSAAKQQKASPAARAAAERWLADVYARLESMRTATAIGMIPADRK